jgi:hypothetical protein
MSLVLKIEKGADVLINLEDYASAASAVSAVGFSLTHGSVAIEAGAAISSAPGLNVDFGPVNKHFIQVRRL